MSVKVKASVEGIRFYRDQWGIIVCSIDKVIKGDFIGDKNGMIFKGTMPEPSLGATYIIIADYVNDLKWGEQYNIKSIYSDISFDKDDKKGRFKFLCSLFTASQIEAMYSVYDDPFAILDAEDVEKLVQIKGCGIKTADNWIRKFKKHINIARIFVELEDYNLTNNMIKRLMNRYNSPDLVIEKVKTNPYILVNEVDGIGWKKADEIALAGNIKPDSPVRIGAYITYYLNKCGEEGCSWITPDQLLGAILDNLGEEIPDENITKAIRELGDKLWWNEDKDKIGLSRYYRIEHDVAEELIRIRNAESNIYCDDWKMKIEHLERTQGWEFTDEQMHGIEEVLKNNVIVIHGLAGSGKTSAVSGVLEVLSHYSSVMCALSGRAASRMSEITGKTGFTIHRLLGYPKGANEYQGFEFNQDNKLPYNIYILDEISMVDARLFYYLLRAIPDGAKLICLGDSGQLESIGCGNIAYDMIHSSEIPTVELTKIHRQAAKSAIITQSIAVRNGKQIIDKDWTGVETRGELQDLELHCYSDKSNTFYNIMEIFSRLMAQKDFDIMDSQIIVPIKTKGDSCTYNINNTVQELYNPSAKNKKEITRFSNEKPFIIREGDKVINTVNNYKLPTPIYNGNIGIVKSIWYNEEIDSRIMTIDFIGIGNVDVPEEAWNGIELGYALTAHKCVTGNTLLYTNKGITPIKDLEKYSEDENIIDEDLMVYNGEIMEHPSNFYKIGLSDCISIKTKRGYELTGTLDHGVDILDENGNIIRKNMEEIKIGDNIVIRKGSNIFGEEILLPKEWFEFSVDVRAIEYTLPNCLTEEFAQFLGHMVADGCITHGGFRFGKNQFEVVEEFSKIVYKIFGAKCNITKPVEGINGGMYQAEVFSSYLRSFLLNIDGLQPNNKTIPKCILSAPKKYQCAFLKGLFEDGTVNLKKDKFDHIELIQCSDNAEDIIKTIHIMLLNLGIISTYIIRSPRKKSHHFKHCIYIYKNDAVIFEQLIGFISKEKKDRLEKCRIKYRHSCPSYTIPNLKKRLFKVLKRYGLENNYKITKDFKYDYQTISQLRLETFLSDIENIILDDDKDIIELYKIKDNYFIDSIVDINEKQENTYCLNMPITHKFVQNGICGWNCQGSQFGNVIFGLDFTAYSLLTRELVYTGITRAQKKCYLVCQTGALRFATAQQSVSNKQTHLQDCLYEVAHPKLVF